MCFQDILPSQNYLVWKQKYNVLLSLAPVKLDKSICKLPWMDSRGSMYIYREEECKQKEIRALWHILDLQKCFSKVHQNEKLLNFYLHQNSKVRSFGFSVTDYCYYLQRWDDWNPYLIWPGRQFLQHRLDTWSWIKHKVETAPHLFVINNGFAVWFCVVWVFVFDTTVLFREAALKVLEKF